MVDNAFSLRDRDELWCRCLCAILDPREVERVLIVFNSERPDKPNPLNEVVFPSTEEGL